MSKLVEDHKKSEELARAEISKLKVGNSKVPDGAKQLIRINRIDAITCSER
jgi:hypothetical protein